MGEMKMAGLYFDLSDTPGKIWGPPAWPGQNTRQILAEVGYSPDEINKLLASGAADDTST
jgi:crotonobetainyl-CoA:carnitine CoA-transferase CaiB-like acyl-CoA transferase